jgi:hypothetical protein
MAKMKPGGRARASGLSLTNHDAAIVEAMIARGDRDHDIAGWFGVNGGRIAGVKSGEHGPLSPADPKDMPPAGSPGPKARKLRFAVQVALDALTADGAGAVPAIIERLQKAIERFDKNRQFATSGEHPTISAPFDIRGCSSGRDGDWQAAKT